MSKVRVPLHGKPHGYATVNPKATQGATVGVDLFWPDGGVVGADALAAAMQGGAAPPGAGDGSTVFWNLIQEIPANVRAVAGLETAGFVRRDGAGGWTASSIVNADLENASTDGLQEGAGRLYFTDTRARDAVLTAEVLDSLEAADGAVQADAPALDPLPPDAPDDTAAAAAGVPVGGLYRDGSVLMIRVA